MFIPLGAVGQCLQVEILEPNDLVCNRKKKTGILTHNCLFAMHIVRRTMDTEADIHSSGPALVHSSL